MLRTDNLGLFRVRVGSSRFGFSGSQFAILSGLTQIARLCAVTGQPFPTTKVESYAKNREHDSDDGNGSHHLRRVYGLSSSRVPSEVVALTRSGSIPPECNNGTRAFCPASTTRRTRARK